MLVTLKEIAELANVSRATVDKVIHNRPGVKKETHARITAILKELNYQPNPIGQALVNSKHPKTLGVVLTPDYNTYIKHTIDGIHKAEKEFSHYGFDVIVKMTTSLEPAEMIGLLAEFEDMNVAGIALLPIDDEQVKLKLKKISAKGIAIATFNSELCGIDQIGFIGQNHYKGGKVAAGLMGKILPANSEIGIIISSRHLTCHQDRLEGFTQRNSQSAVPLKILDIQENQDRKEDAFKATLDFCNRFENLRGIYLTGGGILGVKNALAIVNKLHEIKIICHDLMPETKEGLQEGFVDFVLGQSAAVQGYQSIKMLVNHFIKEPSQQPQYYEIPVEIITSDSLN